jgi:uncharacterized membrane-anchored protein YhcB (DUF1043 family)
VKKVTIHGFVTGRPSGRPLFFHSDRTLAEWFLYRYRIVKKPTDMSQSNNDRYAFILGTLAGVGLGFWLNSNQGREYRQQAAEKSRELGDQAVNYAQNTIDQTRTQAADAYDRGKHMVDKFTQDLKQEASKTTTKADKAIEDARKSFSDGMDKARRIIEAARAEAKK